MPPSRSPTKRGTLASIVTVVMTFEGFLKSCLQKILKPDTDGTAFLRLQQMAKLLSKDYYNKLAGYTTERKVAALIEKARNANEEQVLQLLDFIKDKLGDNASLRIFRQQILNRPTIADPPFNRTRSRLDSAMAKQMEKSQVLMDCLELTTQEVLREAEEMKEAKRKSKEAGRRADALQNENNDLREQMEHFKDLWTKIKKENAKLAEQLKLEKTSDNLAAQLEEQKRIARGGQAEADKQQKRADDLETELVEVKYQLVQAQEDLDDQAKELEEKNIQLEEYKNKLQEAMEEIDGLKGGMEELRQQCLEVKDENREIRSGLAAAREANAQLVIAVTALQKKDQSDATRYRLGARTTFDKYLTSLPGGAYLGDGLTFPDKNN